MSELQLPHSLEAERAILGAILLDNAALGPAQANLKAEDFFLNQHRLIFRAMCALARSSVAIDTVLLMDWLAQHNQLDEAGGAAYLSQLPDGLPRATNTEHYAQIIKIKAQARKLMYQFQEGSKRLSEANGDLSQVVQRVAQDIAIHSAHIREGFGQKESARLFRTAADLAEESNAPDFVVEPYILAGAITELVAKIKAGKTTYTLGEIVAQAIQK
jgi:replicative DNA helicase